MLFYCANTLHNNYRQVDCKILCLENQLKKIENVKWNIIQNERQYYHRMQFDLFFQFALLLTVLSEIPFLKYFKLLDIFSDKL